VAYANLVNDRNSVEEFVFRIEFKDALEQLTHPLFVIVPPGKTIIPGSLAWLRARSWEKSRSAVMMMRF
jgi:hypothetical protein